MINNYDLEIFEARARGLVALYRSGDVSHSEFMELKQDLLDIDKINKQIDKESLKITVAEIVSALTIILSVIK